MKKTLLALLQIVVLAFLVNLLLIAQEIKTQGITVTATVLPTRIIIVDKNLTIQKIISNTSEDVRPIVYLETADGEEIAYSESVRREYSFLKPSLNFSKAGIVYEREERTIPAILKRAGRTVGKWLSLPF